MFKCTECGNESRVEPSVCGCGNEEFLDLEAEAVLDQQEAEFDSEEYTFICVCDCEICQEGGPDEHCEDCELVPLDYF